MTARDAADWLLRCADCDRFHRFHRTGDGPWTWADPIDHHSYRPRHKAAGEMLIEQLRAEEERRGDQD